MSKFSTRRLPAFLLSTVVVLLTMGWQIVAHSSLSGMEATEAVPSLLATAPSSPTLQPAILNGKPIQVLYITRAEDTVLVRCYPGYEPTITLRPMGNNPEAGNQQQGMLTCVSSEAENQS